jgi:hypothetical protein
VLEIESFEEDDGRGDDSLFEFEEFAQSLDQFDKVQAQSEDFRPFEQSRVARIHLPIQVLLRPQQPMVVMRRLPEIRSHSPTTTRSIKRVDHGERCETEKGRGGAATIRRKDQSASEHARTASRVLSINPSISSIQFIVAAHTATGQVRSSVQSGRCADRSFSTSVRLICRDIHKIPFLSFCRAIPHRRTSAAEGRDGTWHRPSPRAEPEQWQHNDDVSHTVRALTCVWVHEQERVPS